jgi:tol-pal system protein YbgF
MNKTITASATALVISLSAVPARAQSRVELQMAAQLQILQEQTQQLALTLVKLDEAIKAVNARIDSAAESETTRFANQAQLIKNLSTEVSAIREGTQTTSTSLGLLKDEVEAMRMSLTSLPSLLAQYAPLPAADPNAPNPAASAGATVPPATGVETPAPPLVQPEPAPSTLGLSPTRMYQMAYNDYQSGQYSVAISGFESFLRTFPQTQLSDDAHLYMGESYFLERKFDQAIASYNQAIQNFPAGDQIPLAYYKRGLAYSELKQNDQARASWEQLLKQFPNSEAAILAKQGLDRINRQTAPAAR